MGNSCLSTSDTTMENRRGQNSKQSGNGSKNKAGFSDNQSKNEKLSFLSNPITRPAGFVDENENQANEDIPPQSLATASRMAALQPKEEGEESHAEKEVHKEEKVEEANSEKKKIQVDFDNTDDNITDQGQANQDCDNHSNNDYKNTEPKESLSFKPNGFLNGNFNRSSTEVPMSFGIGVMDKNKNCPEIEEEL